MNPNQAVLLDKMGRVEFEEEKFTKPGVLHAYAGADYRDGDVTVPEHIKRNLDKATEVKGPFEPRNSLQTWEETLYAPLADGATYTTPAAEATIFPIFTLPANYLYPGRLLKWTVMGRLSSAITTPGTFIWKLSYSATGLGAVAVATTGAFAPDPTAAATTLPWMYEAWMICRSIGTSGTGFGWIRLELGGDYDDASATTLKGNLDMTLGGSAGVGAPATVAIDTTVARALNPTYTPSVTTASMTGHVGFLEAIT
jgi:hypothetical protein